MAYAYEEKQDQLLNAQGDEQKQDNAVLTSTAGELGAESSNAPASGQSVRPSEEARQPQRAASQVLVRNQGKAANPFQFGQTRQALAGAKQGVQSERDTYMQNATAPYQTGAALTGQVQQYARAGGATPEWLKTYQQGTPQPLQAFKSQTSTNFAPVNALTTNAGVRNYLRNPADPESRSGEQAIDFSLLNADPNFNLEREGVLRDYSDLLKFRQGVEAETPAAARAAQQKALDDYKANISQTLENEAAGIQNAAQQAESAYDAGYTNLADMRQQVARDVTNRIAAQTPENLRPYIQPIEGPDLDAFFNPLTGESTRSEDFITGDQAQSFNRIMALLGRGGNIATAGRLAGKTGPTAEDLRFDEMAYRNLLQNNAMRGFQKEQDRLAQEAENRAEESRKQREEANKPAPPPQLPPINQAQPGQLAINVGDIPYSDTPFPALPDDQYNWTNPPSVAGIGQLAIELSHGGRVPGKAPMFGDHKSNDVVSAKLSPGEIVIPRSAAQDKESAKEFIDNMPFGKTRDLLKNKYNCGGKVGDNYACGGKIMPKMKGY